MAMGSGPGRRLIVVRHAKAAWPEGVADEERPLAGRGRRDAPRAGRWLAAQGWLPDHVICSPARRTRETLTLISGEWEIEPPVDFDARVYAAELATLLAVVRGAPPSARTLMLVGHNPGMHGLTMALVGDSVPEDAVERVEQKFPTCAIAMLEAPASWSALAPGRALLTRFAVPDDFG
jgi:phosphohistidine phosphatase